MQRSETEENTLTHLWFGYFFFVSCANFDYYYSFIHTQTRPYVLKMKPVAVVERSQSSRRSFRSVIEFVSLVRRYYVLCERWRLNVCLFHLFFCFLFCWYCRCISRTQWPMHICMQCILCMHEFSVFIIIFLTHFIFSPQQPHANILRFCLYKL